VQHALWYVEHKYSGKIAQKQVNKVLHITKHLLNTFCEDTSCAETIPADFQQALQRTKHLVLNMIQRDGCQTDHYLFKTNELVCAVCGLPRYDSNGKPFRSAFYVNPVDFFQQLLTISRLAQSVQYMRQYVEEGKYRGEEKDELRDFMSGSIFKEVVLPYIRANHGDVYRTLLGMICHDEVEITRWPKKNITPILISIFNVPPWIRQKMFMLFLVGLMPVNCKNHQVYLEPVVEMFAEIGPATGGFEVPSPGLDAVLWWAMLVVNLNDMRGLSKGSMQVQAPSKNHACNNCAIKAYWSRAYGTSVYPGAVTLLPKDDPLRRKYHKTFRNLTAVRDLAKQTAARFLTKEYILAAMDIGDHAVYKYPSKAHPCWTYGFKGTSVFVKHLVYWRPWMMTLSDTDHMILNRMRNIISLWAGTNNMNITAKKMEFEFQVGRFMAYKPVVTFLAGGIKTKLVWPKQPWKCLPSEKHFIDEFLPQIVKLPQSMKSGRMAKYFSDVLSIDDAYLFFSGLGLLMLDLMPSIEPLQREAFRGILESTALLLHPVTSSCELPEQHLNLVRAQTKAEMAFPLSFCTIACHAFLEIFQPVRGRIARVGTCIHVHMVGFERYNKRIRGLLM